MLLSAYATKKEDTVEKIEVEHLALAAELFGAAILVHDAALGEQGGLRRRVARKLLGGAQKWIGGNLLTIRALELARHSSSEHVQELIDLMRDVSTAQSQSQRWGCQIPPPADLREHFEKHTAALFSFTCRAGARVAGAERTAITALGRYGFHVGMAWNIAEEVYWLLRSQEEAIALIEAHANHKEPLYTLSLLAQERPEIQHHWEEICQTGKGAAEILSQIKRSAAIPGALEYIVACTWSAQSAIKDVPTSPHRDALIRLLSYLHRPLRDSYRTLG